MQRLFNVFIVTFLLVFFPFTLQAQEATAEATPPLMPEELPPLRPFVLETSGFSGVAPLGWDALRPGTFLRDAENSDDVTYVIHVAGVERSIPDVLNPFLPTLGLAELPQPSGDYTGLALEWTLYETEMTTGTAPYIIQIATASDDNDTAFLVIMQSPQAEREMLDETVFFPSLDFFGMPADAIYERLGLVPVRPVQIPEYDLGTVVPLNWLEVGPGLYARGDLREDGTTLLVQSDPDLTPEEFGNLLLDQLGLDDGLPQTFETITTPTLEWSLYEFSIESDADPVRLFVALASDDQQAYLVALLSAEADAEAFREAVLLPVINATQPSTE